MKQRYKDKTEKFERIANERIAILFSEADKMFGFDSNLSNRYVFLARKIAMKCRITIPSNLKRRFCKKCHAFLVPGKNVTVRTHEGKVVYHCHKCKQITRYPYIKEQKAKRAKKIK